MKKQNIQDKMMCGNCKKEMVFEINGATQGWICSICKWSMITTCIEEIYIDMTEYSICIKNGIEMDKNKIKWIAKIAKVNFIIARKMIMQGNVCILKAKAPEIKMAIKKLEELEILFEVSPQFRYK